MDKEHKQKVKAKKRNYAKSIASSNTTGNVEEETKVAQEWLDCLLNDISEAKKACTPIEVHKAPKCACEAPACWSPRA